jgi:hypothetical protein
MVRKAKDLSPEQKNVGESLLGRAIAPHEAIIIRAVPSSAVPEWLEKSWESAKGQGVDQLTIEEIDAEIAAARKARHENRPATGQ